MKTSDLTDKLYFKSMQLQSLLTMIGGEGRERFNCLNDKLQANYLWACNDLADEIEALAEMLTYPEGERRN